MERIIETMSKAQADNYFKDGVKDWGDQVDVFIRKSEKITDIEGNEYFDMTFIRCSKSEYESNDLEGLMELADIEEYGNKKVLKEKIENQAKAIDLMLEMI